ncbi:MAG: hypothetical protein R2873_30505 [Caldilineaceae bacterium]
MTRITAATFFLLALLVTTLLGARLVQHNVDAFQVKRVHGARLAAWDAPAASAGDFRKSPALGAAGDPCAFLPWVAGFPQLAPRPTACPPTAMTDLWAARQSWLNRAADDACTRWQRQDAWVEPLTLLDLSVDAAAWDDVRALLACLEGWDLSALNEESRRRLTGRAAVAYRRLGDHLEQLAREDNADALDEEATRRRDKEALAAYAAADRWDPNQQRQGTSAAARLLTERGDVVAALALLQAAAADETLPAETRYRLWMETAALLARDPGRTESARQDAARAAYDVARRLRPDQIGPYTGLAALYRDSNPAWSAAALNAGLDSPAAATAANRRVLLRQLGDLHRSLAEWEAAACAYRAALAQPVAEDTERGALQQLIDDMETRLGRSAGCG